MQPAAILSVLVTANTSQASRSMLRFNATMRATESSSNKALGAVKTLAKGATIGAGAGLAYAVKKAADFEQQLDSLGAVSDATGRQMEQLRRQAMAAGAATKFSALDAAEAQTELAKGGLRVGQIMRGGLKSALALAAAGELELADAAATTANAMNLFGLKGKDAMKVADQLATAANATTADVSDFAMALTQGGSVAKSAGLSFRETVLALEALAKSGIKNSDAGTSLKTSLIQLLKPTAKQAELTDKLNISFLDQQGHFKNLSQIADMLHARLGGMTKAQRTATLATIAGTDGVRTLTSIYDAGSTKLDKWRDGLGKSGTAADVAAKKQDNLKGKLENLQGSVETIAIAFGSKLLPALTDAAEQVTDVFNDKSLSGTEKFDKLGEMAADAIGKAGPVVGKAAAGVGLIAVRGFFNAFRESPLWLKLLTAGFILSKLGGFSAFKRVGLGAGSAMAGGIAEGATKNAGRTSTTIAGRFKGLGGAFKTVGQNVLGAALLTGIADAATRQGISGFGDRFQQFASTATLGFLPSPRDVDQRLATIADKIRSWKGGSLRLSDPSDPDNSLIRAKDLDDFTGRQRKMLQGLATLRNTATEFFGKDFKFTPKMEVNPEAATKKLRGLENEFGRMKSGAVLSVKELRSVTGANFQRIADTMGTRSAEGQKQVSRNFRLAVGAVVDFRQRGVLNASQAGKQIAFLMKSNTGKGKDALSANMLAAEKAIARTMSRGGQITKQGTDLIRALMVNAMKNMGLSPDTIRMSLNKRESAKHGPVTPGQTGLVVSGGKPAGDSVHALLERGEVVVNRTAVQKLGGPREVNKINKVIPRFQSGGIAGMVGAANQLERAHFPYLWGGGHQGSPAPFGPMDCSGAVSYVLQHGGVQIPTMTSGLLAGAGAPGAGKVTVFANQGHTFMRIGNRYFGTSGSNPGGGAGWFPDPGNAYKANFAQRHFAATGGVLDKVPRLTVDAPDSMVKTMVQGALDKTRAGANKKLRDVSSMAFGGGDVGDPGPFGKGNAANRKTGQQMAARFGWGRGKEWGALDDLWGHLEGSWDENLANLAGSGAYGIAQALPASKYPPAGQPAAPPGHKKAVAQIGWGLNYIKGRYGDPLAAHAFRLANNYYAKGGMVGYAGDSLGVGTVPKLKQILAGQVDSNVVSGRDSSSGLSALKGMLKGKSQFVFDLGTNDSSAGQLSGNLSAADRATGSRPIHALTLLGPAAGKKNAALRAKAGGDIRLVDWAKVAGQYVGGDPQHIHPNDNGYARRAQMVAASIRKSRASEELTKGQKRQVRHAGHGPLGTQFAQTIKALKHLSAKSKFGKLMRNKRVDSFAKKLKGFGVLPGHLDEKISILTGGVDEYGDFADRAGQLNVDNDDGTSTLGVFRGNNEAGWLKAQLSRLWALRNFLADAQKILTERRAKLAAMVERVRKLAAHIRAQIEGLVEHRHALEKRLKQLKKNPKVNRKLIDDTEFALKMTKQSLGDKVQTRKDLGKVLGDSDHGLIGTRTKMGTALSDTIVPGMEAVQGKGGPQGRLKTLPGLGVLGGSIFDVQLRLRDLAAPTAATDNSPVTDSESLEQVKQLLREANQRTAVSDTLFKTLKDFKIPGYPFLGSFEKGGVFLAGEKGPELVHTSAGSGRVYNATDTQQMLQPTVNVSVMLFEGEDKALVEVNGRKVEAEVRRMARHAGRGLPSQGGG